MRIIKINNGCNTFQKPKGKIDTQLYPECEGTKFDRDVVRKSRSFRKKRRKQIKNAKLGFPIRTHDSSGIWDKWKNHDVSDEEFVEKVKAAVKANFAGLPEQEHGDIRGAISNIISLYESLGDAKESAFSLDKWLQEYEKRINKSSGGYYAD